MRSTPKPASYEVKLPYSDTFFPLFLLSSFGLAPAGPLQVLTPLSPNQSIEVTLPLSTVGPVMKMDPLTNLQVTISAALIFLQIIQNIPQALFLFRPSSKVCSF